MWEAVVVRRRQRRGNKVTVTRRLWIWSPLFALAPIQKPGVGFRHSTRNTSKNSVKSFEWSILILVSLFLPWCMRDTTRGITLFLYKLIRFFDFAWVTELTNCHHHIEEIKNINFPWGNRVYKRHFYRHTMLLHHNGYYIYFCIRYIFINIVILYFIKQYNL